MVKSRAYVAFAVAAVLFSGSLAGLGACCLPVAATDDHACCADAVGLRVARLSCCAPAPAPVAEKAPATTAPLVLLLAERVAPADLSVDPGFTGSPVDRSAVLAPPPPLVLRI